jgi:N-glycosyltransferase
MRVLVTPYAAPSHLRALAPAARAFLRRGHRLAVAVAADLGAEAAAYGLDVLAVPAGGDAPRPPLLGTWASPSPVTPETRARMVCEDVLRRARRLVALAAGWRPDLVVRDNGELAGWLAGEALGVPHVSVQVSGREIDAGGPADRAAMVRGLNGARTALGLAPDPGLRSLFRHLHASLMPPAFDPRAVAMPAVRCYRHRNPRRLGEEPPAWLGDLPVGRPVVLASAGTLFHDEPGRVEAVLAALARVDCSAIVAVGRGRDVRAFGPQPEHVRLVDEVAQPQVLECCDAFLTHGGFNAIRESLHAGVPMVIAPMTGDQPGNARRCAELGVARSFSWEPPPAEALAGACRAVLGDPAYRARARAMQRRMRVLPPLDCLVADAERLVGKVAS